MRELIQRYPGRSGDEIFAELRRQLWDRRREISSSDLIDDILSAVRWEPDRLRAGGTRRVMLLKSSVELWIDGETLTLRLSVPVRQYEDKYADRIRVILETLFD